MNISHLKTKREQTKDIVPLLLETHPPKTLRIKINGSYGFGFEPPPSNPNVGHFVREAQTKKKVFTLKSKYILFHRSAFRWIFRFEERSEEVSTIL